MIYGIRIRESGLMPPGKIALEQDGKIVGVVSIDDLAEELPTFDAAVMSQHDLRRLEAQIEAQTQNKPVNSAG
jgi:hypothetical protein